MEVIQPGSRKEFDLLLRSRYRNDSVTYFRLSDHPHDIDLPVEFGKGVIVKDEGSSTTVMTAGPLLGNVLEAVRDLKVNLVYFHTIKPIDSEVIRKFKDTEIIIVHDAFGLHEAISETPNLRTTYHGLGDSFCCCYGTLHDIRKKMGLDPASIREFVRERIGRAGGN